MSRHNFKWTMKLFFHLLDLTVLNSWILLSSCGAQYTHQDFRLLLVRNLIEEDGKSQDRPTPSLVGRPSVAAANNVHLESRHNQHRPVKSTQLRCRLCSSRGWPEKGHGLQMHQVWRRPVRGALFCGILHKSEFVDHWELLILCAVIKLWSKVPQIFCSNQNYESNKLFTPHFI